MIPCSVDTSMSSSGHRAKWPTLVARGLRNGTTTSRTVTSRTHEPRARSAHLAPLPLRPAPGLPFHPANE